MNPIQIIRNIILFFNPPKISQQVLQAAVQVPPFVPETEGLFLITLTNSKDTEISVVNHEVWNWIMEPNSPMPAEIQGPLAQETLPLNAQPNDRAFLVFGVENQGPGRGVVASFFSVKELTNYLSSNSIQIKDEFEGYIY